MSDISRFLLDEAMQEINELKEENNELVKAAYSICQKWVHPDAFGQAMAEINNAFKRAKP